MKISIPRRVAMPVAAIVAATTMGASLAACGSPGGTPAAGSSPTASSAASGAAGFAAYRDCLASHGVTIPTNFPSGSRRPRGTRSPGAGNGGGGGFGGFFGGGASANPTLQAALTACAHLRPAGGRGFAGSSALNAFRTCMTRAGVTIPTGSPSPGARRGFLGGLNTNDPKVAQAYQVCKALLPTGRPTATASSTSSGTG